MEDFNLHDIDDFICANQDHSLDNDLAANFGNAENASMLYTDSNNQAYTNAFLDSFEVPALDSFEAPALDSFEVPATVSDSSEIRMQLKCRIKEKMKAEGKEHTSMAVEPTTTVDQLTPEDLQKRFEKQERNREAARKSRNKKKECDFKLQEDNRRLESEHHKLLFEVTQLSLKNEKFEQIFGTHDCLINRPQQDHGDAICQETSSNQVCRQDESACHVIHLTADDKKSISLISDDLEVMSLTFKCDLPRPEPFQRILNSLQSDQSQMVTSHSSYQSQMVTSHSSYQTPNVYKNGYRIGIQENIEHYNFSQFTENAAPNVDYVGHSNIIPLLNTVGPANIIPVLNTVEQYRTNMAVQSYNCDIASVSPQASAQIIASASARVSARVIAPAIAQAAAPISARCEDPWSTATANRSEEIESESLKEFFLQPPPEKKLRRE